jgi:hypothetical protein
MTTLLTPGPLQTFQTRYGTTTSDINSLIYGVIPGSPLFNDLRDAGCLILPPGAPFGSGSALALTEGNIFRTVSGAVNPGATGVDSVLAVYSLPANSFDGIGNRGLNIQAFGSFANNANGKRAKLFFNPTAAVVGSTISGGTLIADTGASTGANVGWNIGAQVFKYGASGSNTQYGQETNVIIGGVHSGMGLPLALTAAENAAILIAVTGNAATLATDMSLAMFEVNALN